MSLDFYLQYTEDGNDIEVFSENITHNLGEMADKAGIYYALWRPEEKGWVYAKDIIKVLEKGVWKLERDPVKYKKYNSPNGWGMYEHFVPFAKDVLEACKKYPSAKIYISR